MILIVTYDLRSPKDYHDLYEVVKQQGKWWHYMASTWLLSTTREPQQVVDVMLPYMDSSDLLFVCELTPKYQGRLPQPAWEWIEAEIKALPVYPWPLGGISPFAPPTMPDTKNPWIPPTVVPGSKPDIVPGFRFPPVEKKK